MIAPSHRTFLFLQGPQSAFFRRLGRALSRRGARVIRVNLCGGDVVHWHGRLSRLYTGPVTGWPSWIARLMREEKVTDLLLFGDWRPMHWEAVVLSRQFGIRLHVFEEGYLRPDYITMEDGGVNGNSSMPSTPEEIREEAALFPEPMKPLSLPNPLRRRVYDAVFHHVANFFLFPLFFRYRTHRPHMIGTELLGLIPRLLTSKKRQLEANRQVETFFKIDNPYFFFPLQLDSDAQVRRYSPFAGMCEGIGYVIASFATHAPLDMHLLIKNHPLDNGLIKYRHFIEDFAVACGVGKRVFFVEDGPTQPMIRKSQGVVLLNSTLGLSALRRGRGVYCIGKSIYAMPGLAASEPYQSLDSFWVMPTEPDMDLLKQFIKVLKVRTLVNGNFYTAEGICAAVGHCLVRLGMESPSALHV